MSLRNLLREDDYREHADSNDYWSSISNQNTRSAYRMRVVSWILRIYCGFGGMPAYVRPGNSGQGPVAQILELPELEDPGCSAAEVQQLLWQKAQLVLGPLSDFERQQVPAAVVLTADSPASEIPRDSKPDNWPVEDCTMRSTLHWLAQSAALSPVEEAIFELSIAMRVFQIMHKAVEIWGSLNRGDLPHALSALLNVSMDEALAACHPQSTLWKSGIVRLNRHGFEFMNAVLHVPRTLAENIAYHQGPPQTILSHMAQPLRPSSLNLEDFAHIESHTRLPQAWLAGVLDAARRGEVAGHMLVSGDAGLGKTEWVGALLLNASTQTMAMVAVNDLGQPLTGEDRLMHLRMLLRMMRSTERGVILFDEADDVFRPPGNLRGSGDSESVSMDNHRASLNFLLEDSRIPVVWIMNRPEILDPAVLRRFDVVIAFEGIPESVRTKLIQARFQHRLEMPNECAPKSSDIPAQQLESEHKRWARVESLTPALIDRLGRVSERALHAGLVMDEDLYRHWLRQRLPGKATQHLKGNPGQSANGNAFNTAFTGAFDPEAWGASQVNASVNLIELVEGIRKAGSARLALCGAPGTGKTAFARALARLLDKPLLERRASDLLSAYVGETEQRISAAFDQAGEDNAVLFIDEVDGLLANREHAVRNWEVTQVNELLEQLGEFDGVVVVATNRLEAMDPAALRRLDIKIQFEALRPEQIRQGFSSLCNSIAVDCREEDLHHVSQLSGVTPGDFACIARRLRFASTASTAKELIRLLQEELAFKTPARKPIGFGIAGSTSASDATGV